MQGPLGRILNLRSETGLSDHQIGRRIIIRLRLIERRREAKHAAIAGVGHVQVSARIERQTDRAEKALCTWPGAAVGGIVDYRSLKVRLADYQVRFISRP